MEKCYNLFVCVCARVYTLPRGHALHSRREATLCGLHVTGKLSAVRSRWGASALVAAAHTTHTQIHSAYKTMKTQNKKNRFMCSFLTLTSVLVTDSSRLNSFQAPPLFLQTPPLVRRTLWSLGTRLNRSFLCSLRFAIYVAALGAIVCTDRNSPLFLCMQTWRSLCPRSASARTPYHPSCKWRHHTQSVLTASILQHVSEIHRVCERVGWLNTAARKKLNRTETKTSQEMKYIFTTSLEQFQRS